MPERRAGARTILFVHHGQDWIRGSERCLLDLIAHLDRSAYRPVLWCDAPTLAQEARSLDATVHLAPTMQVGARFPPVFGALAQAADALVRAHAVRIIHANDISGFPALVGTARRNGIPLLAHMHLIPTAAERRWSLLHQATMVIGVSRASVSGLLDDGMPRNRVRVIFNGIDVDALANAPSSDLRRELGIAPDALVVTTVASLIARKGLDVVIRAVARLRSTGGRDVHLLLCGDGEDEGALRALATELGVSASTHFLGARSDVGSILRGATDVLVSAARLESLGLTVLEAGACGVPVVVSDIAPHLETVIDGVTGLVVRTDDSTAFADAIGTLGDDLDLRRALGGGGRAHVAKHFTLRRWLTEMHATYDAAERLPGRALGWVGGSTWPPVYGAWMKDAVGRRLRRDRA